MRLIVALADRHGLDVYVRAHADDAKERPESISQGELEAFYEAHGFVDIGNWNVREFLRRPMLGARVETERLLEAALAGEELWEKPSPAP